MGDFPFVEWLAREYKERAEISGYWTDYVKAHGLANFCVAKDCRESRHLVYEIEDSWYNGRHPLSFKEHQQLIDLHKYKLKSYRDETSLGYKQLETKAAKLQPANIFKETNLSLADSLSKIIFEISKKCSEGLIKVSGDIIKSSELLLQRIGLTASCKFVVIGLGSIAKGEATPYSDLEYAFIVEREDSEYFQKLAVDSYFRIGNLCETPLKTFDITELKVPQGCPPIIAENIPAGYRIDGLTKNAGNIPTGNGREGSKTLTLTVDKLMELYKTSAVAPFVGLADLSDMLSSTVVIYTNEGKASQLHRDFVLARTAFETKKGKTKSAVDKKRFQSFSSDINSYTFLPEFIKFQPPGNLNIKVKTDIFRYPTLLANNIKMLMRWNLRYSWQVFSTLHDQRILSKENYRYINIVLAFSIYLRTSTYLNQGYQAEFLYFDPAMDLSSLSIFKPSVAIFVNLGNLLVPIKQSVKKTVEHYSSRPLINAMIISIFQNIKVSTTDFFQKAEIAYFTGLYTIALVELTIGLGKIFWLITCDQFIKAINQTYVDAKSVGRHVELCGYLLYYTAHYSSAIDYLEWLINNKRGNLGLLKLLTAHCKKEVEDYRGVKELVAEAKRHLVIESGGFYAADVDHDDAWASYNDIGVIYATMGEYDEALLYFKKAIRMNIGLHGEVGHRDTAVSYHNTGVVYSDMGDYELSLQYHIPALEMKLAIYGATTNHVDIANSYNSIGKVYRNLCNTDLALEYYIKALDMRKALHGVAAVNSDIAGIYHNIGNIYIDLGKYTLALEFHMKVLAMREDMFGATADHPDIARSYDNIGSVYRHLGNYALTLEYCMKSLNMMMVLYGTSSSHPEILNCYMGIIETLYNMGNYVLSIEYCTKALKMAQAIYGATSNHPRIAWCEMMIATMYAKLGELCEVALLYYSGVHR